MTQAKKPPYLLGLLCLIPMIGAFAGLAMILLGAIRYKDKWLIIIGSTGVAWTIGFYSWMFYFTFHSPLVQKSFSVLTLYEINCVARDIELYKVKTGAYPDSLKQLLKFDKSLSIYETQRALTLNDTVTYFQYHKIGDKYTLFSVGPDAKPNTGDDLYPTVFDSAADKFGLVKPN